MSTVGRTCLGWDEGRSKAKVDLMHSDSCIVSVKCNSPRELLDRARELTLNPDWGYRRRDRWAFRGQMDASWGLVPSAFREGSRLGYGDTPFAHQVTGRDLQSYAQGQAEFFVVRQFLSLADRVGLRVPGDSYLFRRNSEWENVVGNCPGIGTEMWPPPEVHETLAIAQHHGVPTRLLDFTYSHLAASWFAASEVARSNFDAQENAGLALWAIDLDFGFLGAKHDRGSPFTRITVPRAENDYLRAQQGFFLMCDTRELAGPPAFEHALENLMRSYASIPVAGGWPGLDPATRAGCKFELPASYAPELLDLLTLEGIDEAHLRPSLDNVVSTLARQGCGALGDRAAQLPFGQ